MLDWLGVTFVSKIASECEHVEALLCERQASIIIIIFFFFKLPSVP